MSTIQFSSVPGDGTVCDAACGLSGLTFIFGAARSGTTWLAKLLDSSPEVLYSHEPFTKGAGLAYHRAVNAVASGNPECLPDRADVVSELIAARRSFSRPPFFWKRYQHVPFSLPALSWYLGKVTGLNRLPAGQVRGPVHLVIKEGLTSSSLPLAEHLVARAIVLFRHPCAVVNSRLRGERCGAMELLNRRSLLRACDAARSLPFSRREVLAMSQEEALALDWLLTYWPVTQVIDSRPAHVQWLTYEALVEQPELVLRDLFRGCRLPFSRETLSFLARSSEARRLGLRWLLGRRAQYFGVERRVVEPAHQWRTELSPDAIRRVLAVTELFPLARYWPEYTAG